MTKNCVAALYTIALVFTLAPGSADAQNDGTMPMRTPHGDPDISGTFTFRTLTPFQRPEQFSEQETLDAETAALFAASERTRQNRDLFDPVEGARSAGYQPRAEGGVLSYNEFWYERGVDLTDDKRTSLIIDPPDGRLPALTASGEVQRGDYWNDVPLDPPVRIRGSGTGVDRPEDRGLSERCIVGFNTGPPMTPSLYNNNVQLFQTPDTVVIYNEMIHDARIVPLADRALPAETIKQWMGVSRGRWEGDTLVVETTHFNDLTGAFDPDVHTSYGSGLNVHLTERFTRVDEDTLNYEYTVDDPITFARPFTVLIPMQLTEDPMYGYACHEGNRGLEIILSGGHADDLAHERKGR